MEVESAIAVIGSSIINLMGSEVFSRTRVEDGGAEKCQSSSKSDRYNLSAGERYATGTAGTSTSSSWAKETTTEIPRLAGLLPNIGRRDGVSNGSVMTISLSEVKALQQKVGKIPRSGNGCLKRPRVPQMENQLQDEGGAAKISIDKIGLPLLKCANADRGQGHKPRTNLNSKRSDRKNSKVPLKVKNDPFSLKVGLANCGTGPGGSTAFGVYGLKPDMHDLTKFVEDISLNELLDGSYRCPAFGKDKGKKSVNMNENILHTVRKAYSILRVQRSCVSKQSDEMASCSSKEVPDIPVSSSFHVRSDANCSDGQSSEAAVLCSHDKVQEYADEVNAPADANGGASSCEPIDILDRLALPQTKDLESLLQDASKPGSVSRCTDLRQGKPVPSRTGLPPFPWSQNYNSHSKSNSDTAKVSCRTPCQGKWVRIGDPATYFGGSTLCDVDLESLTYDQSLIPSGGKKYGLPLSGTAMSTTVGISGCEQGTAPGNCQTSSLPPVGSGTILDDKLNGPDSPRVLTAAQTLYDLANFGPKYSTKGIIKWPMQPSQKAMKARKSRSNEKPEDILKCRSGTVPDNRASEHSSSHKKPRIYSTEGREEIRFVTALRAPTFWSGPKASRSSPNRSSEDLAAEAKHPNGSLGKQSYINPPPPRVMDKTTTSHNHQQKVKKVVPMDWNRTKM